jgi:DNA polymerase III subunit epsilon
MTIGMPDLAGLPLSAAPTVFFDLETTGLDLRSGHRICEVALLRMHGANEIGRIDSLVNPGRPLDPEAAAVNGLNDAQLAQAPPFRDLAGPVVGMLQGALHVAHNLPFDQAFLTNELAGAGYTLAPAPALDTLTLARRLFRQRSYSLATLATQFSLPPPAHRAMDDVRTLAALFSRLCTQMAELGILTVADALRLERGLLPGAPEPAAPPLVAQALAERGLLQIVYTSRREGGPVARTVRPLYLSLETAGVYLRAFCYLRNDVRTFALAKIVQMDLVDQETGRRLQHSGAAEPLP